MQQRLDRMPVNFFGTQAERRIRVHVGNVYMFQCVPPIVTFCVSDLLIKTGPVNNEARQYEYLIFSQFLKYPVIGYTRNPDDFELFYKDEVRTFLESYNFLNQFTKSYNMVAFKDFKQCPKDYYHHIGDR